MLADDASIDDRRRVVNAGLRHGRDAVIAEIAGLAEVGVKNVTSDVIATRGERLVLNRARYSGRDQRPEMFHIDVLDIVEIDADERFVALVTFDLDDIDAAFAELDARTSPAKRPPTRTRGRSSRVLMPHSTGTNFPRRRRTG